MNADDVNFLEWGFKGLVSAILAIGSWMWVMLVKAVGKNREDLAAHKLESAKDYVTKSEMANTVLQINDTVKRIHDRLDDLYSLQTKGTRK